MRKAVTAKTCARVLLALCFLALCFLAPARLWAGEAMPWDLEALSKAPAVYPAPDLNAEGMRALFFEGPPYKGKPTRVFAWYSAPVSTSSAKFPAMVLVHGGGGTAFDAWVRLWNQRGYAAIAMDTCGCVPRGTYGHWERHEFGGPPGWGGFDAIDEPIPDQWTYHAVSDAILAHSLIRSFPEVDPDRTGVTGISWGGYLTSIIAGVDNRFKIAVPVYGCGFLGENSAWLGDFAKMGPEKAGRWLALWDPSVYLGRAAMPMLWVTGTNDFAYPMDSLRKSYRLPTGPRSLCIRLRMPHGHGGAGENPEEIHALADNVLKGGAPLPKITGQGRDGDAAWITYASETPVVKAELNFTKDTGTWKERQWDAIPATLDAAASRVTATLPEGTSVYYFNVTDNRELVASSEHEELKAAQAASFVKTPPDMSQKGGNLLKTDTWTGWHEGFAQQDGVFVCDNGTDGKVERGVMQRVELNQTEPAPITAVAWSKAEAVEGDANVDYSLYLDLVYADDTPLWGQTASFSPGAHDWERREVTVYPEKPVRSLTFYMLLRRHAGKAWFKEPELREVKASGGTVLFDGNVVVANEPATEGFQVRDAAANSGFARIGSEALGLRLESNKKEEGGAAFFDVTLSDTTSKDRAVTLVYAIPVSGDGWRWFQDPLTANTVEPRREYANTSRFAMAGTGRLSKYPFGAMANGAQGIGLGIDMDAPAFYRVGYSGGTGELYIAYDLGLTPERPAARVRFCRFDFDAAWGFRSALARYYAIFPEHFKRRAAAQGNWMPFAKISAVPGWEDFGFTYKEGNDETAWDDAHGIITFRYTEPMTWWMALPKDTPRTIDAAVDEAKRLASEKGDAAAKALLASGYFDAAGKYVAEFHDTPWCNGAVWSMNSSPAVTGEVTDFGIKWNAQIRETLYGPNRAGDLDGEYIDSSEGYVTKELDFRREHFAGAGAPLTFSRETFAPGVFRGLIAFEYARGLAQDVHAMNKLMMANATPDRLCWLAPQLDVMGTETNWNHEGTWRPMPAEDLLYRRALCKGKPYCFLMNTAFEKWPYELTEKYMKRCLAFGMFPGFFSQDAATGHYFTRPELYDRDRPLFKKYLPLCRRVAEAGWEPIPLAHSSDAAVYVERFGDRSWTVFNDSREEKQVTIAFDDPAPAAFTEILSGNAVEAKGREAALKLGGEEVMVLEAR